MTRNSRFIWIALLAIVVLTGMGACSSYNGMVASQETATTAWADVQATYQRRLDLIPNLAKTVQAYAKHEKSTLEEVTRARASVGQVHIDPSQATPEQLQQYQQAQGQLSAALGRLMVVAERYPELKANENFKDLQKQLEGTENRINEARQKYNEAVQSYNQRVRSMPTAILARFFGFSVMSKFEAVAGAEKAPEIQF